jgi:hypothetical protein
MTDPDAAPPPSIFQQCHALVSAASGALPSCVVYHRRAFMERCCGQQMLRFIALYYTKEGKRHAKTPWFACPICLNHYRKVIYG